MEQALLELIALVREQNRQLFLIALAATEPEKVEVPEPVALPAPRKMYSTETEEDINHLLAVGDLTKEEAEAELKALEFFSSDISGPNITS